MKRLIFINGTMGAGKTTVCQELKKLLPPCAFLDGDWCWDMEPFLVTEETKAMVQENIVFLLRRFLACSAYENVIFCWVMHRQEILDNLLSCWRRKGCRCINSPFPSPPDPAGASAEGCGCRAAHGGHPGTELGAFAPL